MDYLLQKLLSFLFLIQTFSVTHKQTHWVLIKECTAMLAWMVFQIKTHLFFCLLPTSSYFTCIYQQHGRTQVNIHHFPQMGTSLNHLFPSYTNWCQVYAHKRGGGLVWTSFLHQCKYKLSHFLHMRTAGTSNSAMSWAGWRESCLLSSLILCLWKLSKINTQARQHTKEHHRRQHS